VPAPHARPAARAAAARPRAAAGLEAVRHGRGQQPAPAPHRDRLLEAQRVVRRRRVGRERVVRRGGVHLGEVEGRGARQQQRRRLAGRRRQAAALAAAGHQHRVAVLLLVPRRGRHVVVLLVVVVVVMVVVVMGVAVHPVLRLRLLLAAVVVRPRAHGGLAASPAAVPVSPPADGAR